MKLTIEQLADKVNDIISEKFKESPELIKDGRQSSVLSTRRIRDYMTKGLIEKRVGDGKEKWFDDSHVEQLVSLRLLQHNGLSDQYIKTEVLNNLSNSNSYHSYLFNNSIQAKTVNLFSDITKNEDLKNEEIKSEDEEMQNNAMSFLQSLQGGAKDLSPTFNSPKGLTKSHSAVSLTGALENSVNLTGNPGINTIGYAKSSAKTSDTELLRSLIQSQPRQFNEYSVDEKLGVFLKIDSKTDMTLQKKLFETLKNEIINHTKENKND
jgi:DNA-binding transcriptional MerR regulator